MDGIRLLTLGYVLALGFATATNYIPGITDDKGLAFGIFALDIYDDALHAVSALWALIAFIISRNASVFFLKAFGTLYLLDGLLGLATGSGYLDLGIIINGVQDLPFTFKILANLPHIGLGAVAAFAGFVFGGKKA